MSMKANSMNARLGLGHLTNSTVSYYCHHPTKDLASRLGRGRRFTAAPPPPPRCQDGGLAGDSNSRHGRLLFA